MPRMPRICEDGAWYHVTWRGDNREPIFFDGQDYQQYLRYLHRYKTPFKFLLPSYCLMPNHVHLVIQPSLTASLSKIMLCVGTRYTQYFNKKYGRVGHVFQERFYSRLIRDEIDLLVVSRYVHLNPVAACLCQRSADHPWSSIRAYDEPPVNPLGLVDREPILQLITAPDDQERTARYRGFVELPLALPDPSFPQGSDCH